VRSRSLDSVLSTLLFACCLLFLAFSALGQALRRISALLRRYERSAAEPSASFSAHSAGEFDSHRALDAYEKLIDAQCAARQP
jgi:hypothetical protein